MLIRDFPGSETAVGMQRRHLTARALANRTTQGYMDHDLAWARPLAQAIANCRSRDSANSSIPTAVASVYSLAHRLTSGSPSPVISMARPCGGVASLAATARRTAACGWRARLAARSAVVHKREFRPASPGARPALGLAADLARRLRLGWEVQDAVGPLPTQHLDGQVGQQERQAGHVVAGIGDDQDGRISDLPLARHIQPLERFPDRGGGDGDRVVPGTQPDCVQHGGPRGPPLLLAGHERAGPLGDHLGRAPATAIRVLQPEIL